MCSNVVGGCFGTSGKDAKIGVAACLKPGNVGVVRERHQREKVKQMRGIKVTFAISTLVATLFIGPAAHAEPVSVPVLSVTASAGVFK